MDKNDVFIEYPHLLKNARVIKEEIFSSCRNLETSYTINGDIIFFDNKRSKKYRSKIFGIGPRAPDYRIFEQNKLLVVQCITRFWINVFNTQKITLDMKFNKESVIIDSNINDGISYKIEQNNIKFDKIGNYCVSFRPILNMYVMDFKTYCSNGSNEIEWEVELEEK